MSTLKLLLPTLLLTGCADLGPDYVPPDPTATTTSITTSTTGGTTDTGSTTTTETGGTTTTDTGGTTTTTSPLDIDDDGDGYTENEGDCDDSNPNTYLGAIELCDGLDNDCQFNGEASGIVAFKDAAGIWSDVTANYTGTALTGPAEISLYDSGTFHYCDGTFYASMRPNANVTLRGMYGSVTLDGLGSARVIENTYGYNLVIENIILQNGYAPKTFGGGIYQLGGSLSLTNVTVQDSDGHYGGGAYLSSVSATITQSVFSNNSTDLYGGAIFVYNSTLDITDTVIIRNASGYFGGAIYAGQTAIDCTNCTVHSNQATTEGGGFFITEGATLTLTSSDLGDEDTLDTNTPQDITNGNGQFAYNYESPVNTACGDENCGASVSRVVQAVTPFGSGLNTSVFMGNIYRADDIITIDSFSYFVSSQYTCTPSYYVYESADSGSTWTQRWTGYGDLVSSTDTYIGSDPIGIPATRGNYYLLGMNLDYNDCGYIYNQKGSVVSSGDAGFGDHIGYVTDTNWSPVIPFSANYTPTIFTGAVQASH